MPNALHTLSRSYAAKFVAVALAYAALVVLSFHIIPDGGSGTSIVWPPSVLALAILFFFGIEFWPAIAIASFAVLWSRGVYPPLIVTTGGANVVEALLAVYLLNKLDFSPMLNRLRDPLALVFAAVVASAVSASIITVGVLVFNENPSLNSSLWAGLWIGHLVSLISFGPFVLRWVCRPYFTKTREELFEGILVFGSIFILCVLFFWTPYSSVGGISLLYLLILPLIWAALRTGPRGISLALFMLATISVTGLFFGYGTVSHAPDPRQLLFGIQMIVGVLSLIFLLFASITEERKEAVNSLQTHVDQLEVALEKISSEDQAKTDFIAILAHELRNPLSPLLSGLELLKLEERGQPEVLRMMDAHLHTIARLLDDLLDISRITQKKFQLKKEPVEIHAVLKHTLEMVQPQIEARRHTLQVSLPQEELWLNGDPVRLAQIFVNLLTNSAKYTELGGHIELAAERRGNLLVVTVKDNGAGIAPSRLSTIFEPFGGTDKIARPHAGLRIGLSLAKRMTEMHHGTIYASSAGVGKGTEMVVEIPLPPVLPLPLPATQQAKTRGRFFKKEEGAGIKKLRPLLILVVDDNEPAAQGLGVLLEHHGHKVLLAYDAPEALALAAEQRPDVAILDIGLPTMDGYQLAKEMRAAAQHPIVFIALTGYGQPEDRQKAQEAGFNEHLVKPVSIVDVERVLLELH